MAFQGAASSMVFLLGSVKRISTLQKWHRKLKKRKNVLSVSVAEFTGLPVGIYKRDGLGLLGLFITR